MAISLTASGAGSNKLTSTALKPTTWAFTAFLDVDITALNAVGSSTFRFENAAVVQRIAIQFTTGGAFQVAKRDSLGASTTQTIFTDTGFGSNGRILIALVSDGTTAQVYYRRNRQDTVKAASLALGTMSLAPESTALSGQLTGGTSDARATYFNFLLYDTNLTEEEILWQLSAGLASTQRPNRMESLIGWFPFKGTAAAGMNFAGLTDLTLSGAAQDVSVTNESPGPSWLDRYLVRFQEILFTGAGAAAASAFAAAGSGTVTFTGSGAAAMQPFDANGAGTTGAISGTGSAAMSPFAAAGSGAETFTGSGSAATQPFDASGSGTAGGGFVGSGSAAMSSFAATSSGAEAFSGTGSAAASPFGAAGSGTESFIATAAAAMASFAIGGAGIVLGFIGSAVAAMASFGSSGNGSETFTGSGSAGTSPFAADSTGNVPVVAAPASSPWAKMMKPRYARWRRRRDGIV